MLEKEQIIQLLPYTKPFLFVDSLISVSEIGCKGIYTFKEDEFFYQGHFKDFPVTPGVILIECMAQIGLVCLGIYLFSEENINNKTFALSSSEVDFLKAVYPKETVRVTSEKIYYRFNKLKCKVKMYNLNDELVAQGVISGMIISSNYNNN